MAERRVSDNNLQYLIGCNYKTTIFRTDTRLDSICLDLRDERAENEKLRSRVGVLELLNREADATILDFEENVASASCEIEQLRKERDEAVAKTDKWIRVYTRQRGQINRFIRESAIMAARCQSHPDGGTFCSNKACRPLPEQIDYV